MSGEREREEPFIQSAVDALNLAAWRSAVTCRQIHHNLPAVWFQPAHNTDTLTALRSASEVDDLLQHTSQRESRRVKVIP